MKDQVFSGATIDDALAAAAQALGLPRERLRYVVLHPGAAGVRGLSPTPARVAVLLEGGARGPAAPAAGVGPASDLPDRPVPLLMSLVRTLERALDEPLEAEVREGDDGSLELRIEGPGRRWLLADGGEPLAALDHLLRRVLHGQGHQARLTVWCEGWREKRDEALRQRALDLARAVSQDGQPRRMEPLNSYERRIVHMAVAEVAGLRTFSEGEGQNRAVTIAPALPADPA